MGKEASQRKGKGEAENERKEMPSPKDHFRINSQPNVVHLQIFSLKYDFFLLDISMNHI